MKIFHRLLATILCVAIILTATPISGFMGLKLPEWLDFSIMSSAAETSGTCGENVYWSFDDSTGTLTISGEGKMKDYNSSKDVPWTSHKSILFKIDIKEGVTSIGKCAFAGCEWLNNITIPNGVTKVGSSAFSGCKSLKDIIVPNSVTEIGSYAFSGCKSLKEIIIPNSVTSIGEYSFNNCYGLTTVKLSDNLTSISNYLFYGCYSLKNVVIPQTVNSIGSYAFYNCSSLLDIVIPEGVTTINYYTFCNCNELTNITIPNGVTRICDGAFNKCSRLKTIKIPDSVLTIGDNCFVLCESLTSIELNDNITSIGKYAFSRCGKLKDLTLPKNIEIINEGTFYGCWSLESIIIPNGVISIGEFAFYDCTDLNEVFISDSVMKIDKYAFCKCRNLTNLTMSDSIVFIGDRAFYMCDNLRRIVLPNCIATIGERALGCTEYSNSTACRVVNGFKLYGYHGTEAENFAKSKGMDFVTISTSPDNSCGDGLIWTFDKFSGTLNIFGKGPMSDFEYSEVPWDMYLDNIKKVVIGDNITYIGKESFANCRSLKEIVIPKSVVQISDDAFFASHNLTDVYYTGTEEQWNEVSIDDFNEPLLNANIHYNSHMHKYNLVVTEPTCTKQGYTTYTCECGDSYVDNYVDSLEHNYKIVVIKDSTCTEKGSKEQQCTRCGSVGKSWVIQLKEHTYSSVVTPPTCATQGYTTYTCVCGDSYVDNYVNALGHTPASAVEENYVSPTCTENGSKDVVVYCSVCDEEISRETVIIDATGHADNDDDGFCDACNELLDPTVECECNCHKSGITKFFFNFILFFQRLFGANKECACGVAHY